MPISPGRMTLVLAAAPGIGRFHLMDRLLRELCSRGMRSEVFCLDAADRLFWAAQGHATSFADPDRRADQDARMLRAPFSEFAAIDCRLQGLEPHGSPLHRAEERLRRIAPAVFARFDADRPDLVLFHARRTGAHALVQFAAREAGVPVQWTGDGILPGTMQVDSVGIDGDCPASRRSAWDHRDGSIDETLLRAALASVAGGSQPLPLPRVAVRVPSLLDRWIAAWRGRNEGTAPGFFAGLSAWRAAAPQSPHPARSVEMPGAPFVAVLLQRRDDPRMALDAEDAPSPSQLVRAAKRAAAFLDRRTEVVAVLPREGLDEADLAPLRDMDDVRLELSHATAAACMAAIAVVTVNAPHAGIALLAETPVLHVGRAIYGTPGVAYATSLDDLAPTLRASARDESRQLRRRCLSRMLADGHLWCSPDDPDHNGISGWILQIQRAIAKKSPYGADLHYRTGPVWPLASEGLSSS